MEKRVISLLLAERKKREGRGTEDGLYTSASFLLRWKVQEEEGEAQRNAGSGLDPRRHQGLSVTFYLLRYATRKDGVTCRCGEHRAEADRGSLPRQRASISWELSSRKSHIWLESQRLNT
ncbi:hypothetical protein EYF80_059036 [Liparis tanakae]|uniref:Uncharacterized protein n=1 Tax=Liparis tanakae TaxID=230148 RepID=A0A4Z2ER95_9TELE|nr:hypothetical protein EYF80_059036 [Liparis tanakae]